MITRHPSVAQQGPYHLSALDLGVGITAVVGIAAIVASAVMTAVVTGSSEVRSLVGVQSRGAYRVGDRIDVETSVYKASGYTLVVFAKAGCQACWAAREPLQRLRAVIEATPHASMALVTPGGSVGDLEYGKSLGLTAAHVFPASQDRVRVRIAPTLVLVDSEGTIVFAHEGVPGPAAEGAAKGWLARAPATRSRR
jgi:hypothetical protein